MMNLFEVSHEIAERLSASSFAMKPAGDQYIGGTEKFQTDPHWRDCLLFYEYFHGDNGAGIGASHQTGWTGVIARLLQLYGSMDDQSLLREGIARAFTGADKGPAT